MPTYCTAKWGQKLRMGFDLIAGDIMLYITIYFDKTCDRKIISYPIN